MMSAVTDTQVIQKLETFFKNIRMGIFKKTNLYWAEKLIGPAYTDT